MSGVRVSAVIGAYNNAGTLERAAASMLAQTVTDLELILIDDGSADHTAEVITRIAAGDERVRPLLLPENAGIARSLNQALELARAPVVAVLDADDYCAPERLERQLAALDADPGLALVGSRMHEVDEAGRELAPRTSFASGDVRGVLMRFNPIPNGSACFRRDVALGLGGYDPRYRYATEYDLWLRMAEHHDVVALDEPLSTRVMGTSNVAARADRAQTAEGIRLRVAALRRRRTLRGAGALAVPILAWLTPVRLKRLRRRRLGQAP